MPTYIQGQLSAQKMRIAVVIARFNQFICQSLLDCAIDCFKRHGGSAGDLTVHWAPGSFELPLVAQRTAQTGKYDAVICLGVIIRGSTPHFDFIAASAANGISKAALNSDTPIIFGVLTTNSIEQAIERAGTKSGNKGWDAMLSAIEMVDLLKKIG